MLQSRCCVVHITSYQNFHDHFLFKILCGFVGISGVWLPQWFSILASLRVIWGSFKKYLFLTCILKKSFLSRAHSLDCCEASPSDSDCNQGKERLVQNTSSEKPRGIPFVFTNTHSQCPGERLARNSCSILRAASIRSLIFSAQATSSPFHIPAFPFLLISAL